MRNSSVFAVGLVAICAAGAAYYHYDYVRHGENTAVNARAEAQAEAQGHAYRLNEAARRAEVSWEECRMTYSYRVCQDDWPKTDRLRYYHGLLNEVGYDGPGPRVEYTSTNRQRRNGWLLGLALAALLAYAIIKEARASAQQ